MTICISLVISLFVFFIHFFFCWNVHLLLISPLQSVFFYSLALQHSWIGGRFSFYRLLRIQSMALISNRMNIAIAARDFLFNLGSYFLYFLLQNYSHSLFFFRFCFWCLTYRNLCKDTYPCLSWFLLLVWYLERFFLCPPRLFFSSYIYYHGFIEIFI